jgi:acetyl-CoA carboxylase biotin carboxylase subunit
LKTRRALEEFIIEGVETTIGFHKKILSDERFISGRFGTSLVEEMIKEQLEEVEKY